MDERRIAGIFKALGDENRIRILKMLRGGEKCACKLLDELNISQPTLSHHMKVLCDSGIVKSRKVGTWTYYTISRDGVKVIQDYLAHLARARTICLEKLIYDEPRG